ncbi:GNAT family N-acetyltransferase [Leucothrix arctica]|uniref:N-acetyltransferase n=1 Tax=Leucothrix arctica TaxID=1481894 RepID=A0A317CGP7_9GAMM|nr:GNAT family N-acetyltransferase [Leucothrix arctica]PWQ97539.1 N-acetyltransferase [Leucothrix arctica]
MKPQATLNTERLILRAFTDEDAPRVQSIVDDKRISDMVSNIPHPYPENGAITWIQDSQQRYENAENVIFALVEKDTNLVIGAMTYKLLPNSEAELGYWLGVESWGKGYCTEAGRAMIAHGFIDLELTCVYARHLTANPSSGNVITKLGMKHTERREGSCGDKFASIEFYELLAKDYSAS